VAFVTSTLPSETHDTAEVTYSNGIEMALSQCKHQVGFIQREPLNNKFEELC
jgi:hypothetical protein